ncbi:MAG: type II toxin-antitoxin system RelB/DinJ family antitoxin [Ruminococcus sp.]|nr:type II toxin-antitoxin system RelB/DinJ family antitoxin [Ruminococcus sp.]
MTAKVQFNMDIEIKKQMSELCDKLGMTMSQAFNMFAAAFLRERGLPPQVATVSDEFWIDPEMGDLLDTSDKLEDAIKRLENGEGIPMSDIYKEHLRKRRDERKSEKTQGSL